VVQKLLNRQLAAVNILELTNNGGMDTLVEFVKEAVRVSWDGKNLPGIKELDTMTKNLIIPSRSGSDIVNTLKQVSYFIYFAHHAFDNNILIKLNYRFRCVFIKLYDEEESLINDFIKF